MATRTTTTKKTTKPRITGNPMGRPTLMDDERVETLLTAIRYGNPLKTCCLYANITPEGVRQWRKKGEAALLIPAGKRNPSERKYADFVGRLDKAMAEANVLAQANIHKLMTKPVTEGTTPEQQRVILSAASFHLTHRDPENYNTRTRTELTGADGGPIDVEVSAEKAFMKLQVLLGRDVELADD